MHTQANPGLRSLAAATAHTTGSIKEKEPASIHSFRTLVYNAHGTSRGSFLPRTTTKITLGRWPCSGMWREHPWRMCSVSSAAAGPWPLPSLPVWEELQCSQGTMRDGGEGDQDQGLETPLEEPPLDIPSFIINVPAG